MVFSRLNEMETIFVLLISDFNQMPSGTRDIEIPEPEYTDLLNVNVADKKRKLCPDASGSNGNNGNNGNNVRVKKETGISEFHEEKHTVYVLPVSIVFDYRKLWEENRNSRVTFGKISLQRRQLYVPRQLRIGFV